MLDRNINSIIYQSYIKLGDIAYTLSENAKIGEEGTTAQNKLWNKAITLSETLDTIAEHIEVQNNVVYRLIGMTDAEMNKLLACLKEVSGIYDFPVAPFIPVANLSEIFISGGGSGSGQPGLNGASSYTAIVFATDNIGTGLSTVPDVSRRFIAFKTSTAPIPLVSSSFTGLWVEYFGQNGANGINGTNGITYYTYVRYASDTSGTDFSATPSITRKYVGYLITTTDYAGNPGSILFNGLWVKFIGEDGANGVAGTNGKTILITVGPPSNAVGVDGDIALDNTSWVIYAPKAAGVWPAGVSLIGPQGIQGIQGIQGTNGQSQYLFIAYSDDVFGTGFTLTFDISKEFLAILVKNNNTPPVQGDFTGLWSRYKGDGDRWATFSLNSVLIGTGTKNFTVELDLAYTTGQLVVIAQNGNQTNRMEGRVISYIPSTGALSVDVTATAGAGTIADWLINLRGADESNVYLGASPTNITVGGVPSGTALSGRTWQSIIEELLVEYLLPTFSAFSMSGEAVTVEVGTTISGSKTFLWTTTNSGNVQTNSIAVRDETNATDLATGLANDGSEPIVVTSVQKLIPASHTWRIRGTNTQAGTFTRDFIISWQWKKFHGTNASASLTEAQIEALTGALSSSFAGTYSFAAGNYKFLCWPDTFGSPTAATGFKDTATNLAIAMADSTDDAFFSNIQNGWSYGLVSVTNPNGQTINYRVYRSKNILGGSINIQVS